MSYEEFIKYMTGIEHEKIPFEFDDVKFIPEGSECDDDMKNFAEKNSALFDEKNGTLLKDILIFKKHSDNGDTRLNCIISKDLYEYANINGIESTFEKLEQIKQVYNISNKSEYESIKDQFILRPLNYQLHMKELKGCVYQKVGDFALVLYQFLGEENKTFSSRKISREELEGWGMGDNFGTVMQNALENSARLFPARAFNHKTQKEIDILKDDFSRQDVTFIGRYFLISTSQTTNGALALFYPGVVEKLMKIMGGEFTAVFMNINDVMIFDLNDPAAKEFARSSSTSDIMGEMLSKRRYRCNEKGIFAF